MRESLKSLFHKETRNQITETRKRFIWLLFTVYWLLFSLYGCETMQRKFVRKKQKPTPTAAVVIKEYDEPRLSNEELYHQHFAYWKAYQDETLNSAQGGFGSSVNLKRIITVAERANEEMEQMKELLSEDVAPMLSALIDEQRRAIYLIGSLEPSYLQLSKFQKLFEKNSRIMAEKFSISKVKNHIKQ